MYIDIYGYIHISLASILPDASEEVQMHICIYYLCTRPHMFRYIVCIYLYSYLFSYHRAHGPLASILLDASEEVKI